MGWLFRKWEWDGVGRVRFVGKWGGMGRVGFVGKWVGLD